MNNQFFRSRNRKVLHLSTKAPSRKRMESLYLFHLFHFLIILFFVPAIIDIRIFDGSIFRSSSVGGLSKLIIFCFITNLIIHNKLFSGFLFLMEFVSRYMRLAPYPFFIAKLMPITIIQFYLLWDYC